jgi:hypothetical protein
MPRAYVIGARMPLGGSYMAYHIGRLLHVHYGYELINARTTETEDESLFDYDVPMRTIPAPEAERLITDDDILVTNPSYSHVLFGLRLPGRKIMYLQGFQTYSMLDCHFDLYVSVSSLVSRYVEAVYGLKTPVIPAFITTPDIAVTPWRERPEGSMLVYVKNRNYEHNLVTEYLAAELKAMSPSITLETAQIGRKLGHREFLHAVGNVRTLVNVSLAEGFGLVPLEAMSLGTMVTGLDGLGGSDYMRSGENCLVGSVKDVRALPAIVHRALTDETLAERCAQAGRATAAQYGYDAFKTAWLKQLSHMLQRKPSNV